MKKLSYAAAVLALFTVSGCGEVSRIAAPAEVEATLDRQDSQGMSELHGVRFVHRAPHTAPFKDEVASATFVAGTAGSLELHFRDGTPFAVFSVPADALVGASLGERTIERYDTVTISIRRVDSSRYLLDMQPSGLTFSEPASVRFFYENALVPQGAGVWKQEAFGDVWSEVLSDDNDSVIRGQVDDFTLYAMAAPL